MLAFVEQYPKKMTFFMLILEWGILKHRYFRSYWFWGLILIQILFLARYKQHQLFFYSLSEEIKIYYFRPILRYYFVFVNMGCFWKQAIFGKNSKGNPFKNSILGPLFWAVLDARSFFWTFFGKCPFGGGDQKKVWFFHFFVKIEKISQFGLFPLTYYILERFRHVPFWNILATGGKKI